MPESIEEAKTLQAWADAHNERPQPASILQITKHLTFMAATLPSKSTDDESGKMRVAVYSRILGAFSNEAMAYMARRACAELDWFPSPRRCLELAQQYVPPASDKDAALSLCHRFWQGRFEDFFFDLEHGVAEQGTVDSVPVRWRKIAMERGFLRYMPAINQYVIRDAALAKHTAQQ